MKSYKKALIIAVALLTAALLITLCACGSDAQTAPSSPDHTHTFAEGWTHNDQYHWHAATCGHTDETKDKAQHQLAWETTTPATCGAKGVQTGICICGYSETRSIDFAEHSWGKWTPNDDKTHTRTCSNNSAHTETKPCSFDSVVTPPSCTAQGYTTYTCKDCGYSYTSDPTPKTDHTYGSDGTCTECGAPDPNQSAEVTDAELIAALKKNCETQLSNFFMDYFELTFKLSKVENDSWYIEEKQNNITGGTYTLFYNLSTSTRYLIVIKLTLNKSISKKDLVKNNLAGVTFTLSEIYHISYNPAIQDEPYLKTVKKEILDYLHYDKQNAVCYIIPYIPGATRTNYTILVISEDEINEHLVSRQNDSAEYSEFTDHHENIKLTGRKLVADDAEVSDAEILKALQANKELSEYLFDNSAIAQAQKVNFNDILNEYWHLVTSKDEKMVTGFEYEFLYKQQDTNYRYEILSINFNSPITKESFKDMSFDYEKDLNITTKYNLNYNPTIQADNAELTDAIFEALGVEDNGAERFIIETNRHDVGDTIFGEHCRFKVIEISDSQIIEYDITTKYAGTNSQLTELIHNSANIRKDSENTIKIEGRKLVA